MLHSLLEQRSGQTIQLLELLQTRSTDNERPLHFHFLWHFPYGRNCEQLQCALIDIDLERLERVSEDIGTSRR